METTTAVIFTVIVVGWLAWRASGPAQKRLAELTPDKIRTRLRDAEATADKRIEDWLTSLEGTPWHFVATAARWVRRLGRAPEVEDEDEGGEPEKTRAARKPRGNSRPRTQERSRPRSRTDDAKPGPGPAPRPGPQPEPGEARQPTPRPDQPDQPDPTPQGATMRTPNTTHRPANQQAQRGEITGLSGMLDAFKKLVAGGDAATTEAHAMMGALRRVAEAAASQTGQFRDARRTLELLENACYLGQLETAALTVVHNAITAIDAAERAQLDALDALHAAATAQAAANRQAANAAQMIQLAQAYFRSKHVPIAIAEAATGTQAKAGWRTQ